MPKPLDALYGEGASKRFRAAVGQAKVMETETADGVRVDVIWRAGQMKIACSAEEVRFLSLESDRKGRYSQLCERLPALFAELGVRRFVATPRDRESERILRKRGVWRRRGRRLIWGVR